MNQFSLSAFINVLVTTFVTLTLLVASTDEGFHIFSHTGVHSEHHHSKSKVDNNPNDFKGQRT